MRGGWVSGDPVDEESRLDREAARRVLLEQLRARGLEGFGLDGHAAAVAAAGALVHYLRTTQKADLAHVRAVAYRQRADALGSCARQQDRAPAETHCGLRRRAH